MISPNTSASQPINFGSDDKQQLQTAPKTKRATSFVRKKPPFERGMSAQSALRINKNVLAGKFLVTLKTNIGKSGHENSQNVILLKSFICSIGKNFLYTAMFKLYYVQGGPNNGRTNTGGRNLYKTVCICFLMP